MIRLKSMKNICTLLLRFAKSIKQKQLAQTNENKPVAIVNFLRALSAYMGQIYELLLHSTLYNTKEKADK